LVPVAGRLRAKCRRFAAVALRHTRLRAGVEPAVSPVTTRKKPAAHKGRRAFGAGGRTRTGTLSPAVDFESRRALGTGWEAHALLFPFVEPQKPRKINAFSQHKNKSPPKQSVLFRWGFYHLSCFSNS